MERHHKGEEKAKGAQNKALGQRLFVGLKAELLGGRCSKEAGSRESCLAAISEQWRSNDISCHSTDLGDENFKEFGCSLRRWVRFDLTS
jgi:hypothetical protein